MGLDELFDSVSKKLKIEFEKQAKILGHPGEVGTGRENVLKSILTRYIPKRYTIDSGFVIDALNGKSEQIDIVIYEANYTPVFEIVEGKRFFPCETVVAVGQVRTKIGSRKEMQECLNNIKSVKELDRSNKGTNLMITGPGISIKGIEFDPNKDFRDQIFGFIFCSSTIKAESIITELQKFNKQNDRKFWTNLIVNYNDFLIEYLGKEFLTQDPMKAQQIILTNMSQTPNIFGLFISLLNEILSHARARAREGPDKNQAEIAQMFIEHGFSYLEGMYGSSDYRLPRSSIRTIEEAVDLSEYIVSQVEDLKKTAREKKEFWRARKLIETTSGS